MRAGWVAKSLQFDLGHDPQPSPTELNEQPGVPSTLAVFEPTNRRRSMMTAATSLREVYADEIRDLWSANDQMAKVVQVMAEKAHDAELKKALQNSIVGISEHTNTLKTLLSDTDDKVTKEHCKGMEGLVNEATKHISKEAPGSDELLDAVIVAQYQRMSHYGLAGFGTAAAYAQALGLEDHKKTLSKIVSDIYKADEYASQLAQNAERAAASVG
jgi:ferritin-like metal-binding protein YciE